METPNYDIQCPDLTDPAEFERYLNEVMTKIDCEMHKLDLGCCGAKLPDALVRELVRIRTEHMSILCEVRSMGCIVKADQNAVGDMLLRTKRLEVRLDKVKETIISLEERTTTLESDVSEHEERLKTHSDMLEQHKLEIVVLDKKLDEHDEQINRNKTEIDQLDSIIAKAKDDIEENKTAIENLDVTEQLHGKKIGELEEWRTSTDEHQKEQDEQLQNLDVTEQLHGKKIGELEDRMNDAEDSIARHTQEIGQHDEDLQNIADTLKEHEDQIRNSGIAYTTLVDAVNDNTLAIEKHEKGISDLDKRVTATESEIKSNADNIETVLETITAILGDNSGENIPNLSELIEQVNANTEKNTEQDTKLTNMQTALTTAAGDASYALQSVNTAITKSNAAKNAIDAIVNAVAALAYGIDGDNSVQNTIEHLMNEQLGLKQNVSNISTKINSIVPSTSVGSNLIAADNTGAEETVQGMSVYAAKSYSDSVSDHFEISCESNVAGINFNADYFVFSLKSYIHITTQSSLIGSGVGSFAPVKSEFGEKYVTRVYPVVVYAAVREMSTTDSEGNVAISKEPVIVIKPYDINNPSNKMVLLQSYRYLINFKLHIDVKY